MSSSPTTAPATTGRVLHWAAGYDLLAWLLTHGRSRAFRERLADLAQLAPGESVLDVGCGTGSLAIAAKRRVGAGGTVFGIDPSPAMIARAISKAANAGLDVRFKMAVAEALPFPDAQFDVVLSTLMLHHLPRKVRQQCVREIHRVLKPQGRVLVVDFAQAQSKSGFLAHIHRRHGHVDPRDAVALLEEARFRCVESGPVGVSSLYFVLAVPETSPMAVSERSASAPPLGSLEEGGHQQRSHSRTWIAILVVVALIATHAALFALGFRGHLSVAVVAGMAGILALKYGLWRFRRSRSLTPPADTGHRSAPPGGA